MNAPAAIPLPYQPAPRETARIVVIDDHSLFRNGLRDLYTAEPGVEVVGEAGDVDEGLRLVRELRPDLVTVDIVLGAGDGLRLVEKIRAEFPQTAVLVISMYDDGVFADRAVAAGAAGYLCKQASVNEMREALRIVRKKGIYFSHQAMERLVKRGPHESRPTASEESQLSTRELQIFTFLGQGETTQSIATKLQLSPSTVETYRERIKTKLNIGNGSELVRRAILWVMGRT